MSPPPQLHLGYCTNVHPGESLDEIRRVLATDVAAVRALASPPFGLGLRLGNAAATALSVPDERERFADELRTAGLEVFTVNGFPYGDFAAETVKADVYRPDWRTEERRRYTRRVAEALVALPGPSLRTVSTVAGGFKPETDDSAARRAMVAQLEGSARDLAALADRTGVGVRLCLEPEPFTTLETTPEAIELFAGALLPLGQHVRDHLGLCYDCCHQAVQYEDPVASLRALHEAGVAIGKIQISSALVLPSPGDPAARAALMAFAEPRFLHQVVARFPDGSLERLLDLPQAETLRGAESWRCHFHVPIGWAGDAPLGTTRADWQAAVAYAAREGLTDHFEVETYTWGVLPEGLRPPPGGLPAALADELRAAREALGLP